MCSYECERGFQLHSFFFCRILFSDSGSTFLIFWHFEAGNILNIFLEYMSIEYVCQRGVAFLSLQMIAFIPLYNILVPLLYNVSCCVHVEHVLSQSRTSYGTAKRLLKYINKLSFVGNFYRKLFRISKYLNVSVNIFICCTQLYS